jgi:hypothetical protein
MELRGDKMTRPTRMSLIVAAGLVLAVSLMLAGVVRHGSTGVTNSARAEEPLTGRALADELGLELLPEKPESCMNYVEVDNPAGYCIADIVRDELESYRLGLLLREMPVTDLGLQIFSAKNQLASTPDESARWVELATELRALLEQQEAETAG